MSTGFGHSVGLSITLLYLATKLTSWKKEDTGNLAKHTVAVLEQDNMDAVFGKNRGAASLTVRIRRK